MKYYHLNAIENAVEKLSFYQISTIIMSNGHYKGPIYGKIEFNNINQFSSVFRFYNLFLKISNGSKDYYYKINNDVIDEILSRKSLSKSNRW